MKLRLKNLILLSAVGLWLLTGCGMSGAGNASAGLQIGESFEITNWLSSGSLQVTVKNARQITDVSQLPPQDMFLEQYDHYVSPEGTLKEGSSLILLDLEVKNLDARGKLDLDTDNPYLFRADGLLTLIDLTEKQGKNYYYVDVDYFSLFGCCQDPDHPFLYELKPGDSIEFTVGYFIGKKRDSSERDLSQIRACTSSGNANSDFIDLKLGENHDA